MRQISTNVAPTVVVIENIALTNAQTQAEELCAEFAADPDYFGDSGDGELAYQCFIHWHNGDAMQCAAELIAEHHSNKKELKQYIIMESEDALPERFILRCTSKQTADRLEKKIKDRDKAKKWKERKDIGI